MTSKPKTKPPKTETIVGLIGFAVTGAAAVLWLSVAAPAALVFLWAEHKTSEDIHDQYKRREDESSVEE